MYAVECSIAQKSNVQESSAKNRLVRYSYEAVQNSKEQFRLVEFTGICSSSDMKTVIVSPNSSSRQIGLVETPFTKQILEFVSINNSPSAPGLLMNSRAEFQQGQVATVEVVRGLGGAGRRPYGGATLERSQGVGDISPG